MFTYVYTLFPSQCSDEDRPARTALHCWHHAHSGFATDHCGQIPSMSCPQFDDSQSGQYAFPAYQYQVEGVYSGTNAFVRDQQPLYMFRRVVFLLLQDVRQLIEPYTQWAVHAMSRTRNEPYTQWAVRAMSRTRNEPYAQWVAGVAGRRLLISL